MTDSRHTAQLLQQQRPHIYGANPNMYSRGTTGGDTEYCEDAFDATYLGSMLLMSMAAAPCLGETLAKFSTATSGQLWIQKFPTMLMSMGAEPGDIHFGTSHENHLGRRYHAHFGTSHLATILCLLGLSRPALGRRACGSRHGLSVQAACTRARAGGPVRGAIGFGHATGKTVKFVVRIPWEVPGGANGVDTIYESTGIFTDMAKASAHLTGGARKAIQCALSADAPMLVMGVNQPAYTNGVGILSNSSCSTPVYTKDRTQLIWPNDTECSVVS